MTPVNAFSGGKKSGKKARQSNPKAENASEATILARYPILSTNFAQKISTTSCVKKNVTGIRAMSPNGI